MKKMIAVFLSVMMVIGMCCALVYADDAEETEKAGMTEEEFEELLAEVEDYEPAEGYDKYTVCWYFKEDISADMYSLVSAKEDNSEFDIQVFWYGVDDHGVVKYDGKDYETIYDESGFMKLVAPEILDVALAQDYWKPISAGMTEEEFEELLAEVEDYEPAEGYDKYTVCWYFKEDISADMYSLVSAKEDNSEFDIQVFWYGVDDHGVVKYDGKDYETIYDESGFMKLVAPEILDVALAQDYWKEIPAA